MTTAMHKIMRSSGQTIHFRLHNSQRSILISTFPNVPMHTIHTPITCYCQNMNATILTSINHRNPLDVSTTVMLIKNVSILVVAITLIISMTTITITRKILLEIMRLKVFT